MKSVLTSLTKSVLISLESLAASLATGQAFKKKIFWSGTTALIISNKGMDDIMKIVKYLEDSGLLI